MKMLFVGVCIVFSSLATGSLAFGQANAVVGLRDQVETLELKLAAAEQALERLEAECVRLRQRVKQDAPLPQSPVVPNGDPFTVGSTWVGTAVDTTGQRIKWAISVSSRNGKKFGGAIAVSTGKRKFEFPVSGTVPESGDGLVLIESTLIGPRKLFARGQLVNEKMEISYSATTPKGRNFGLAILVRGTLP